MFNLIQKFFKTEFSDKQKFRENFSSYFFSLPEHQWLLAPEIRRNFEQLFQRLPVGVLEAMSSQYPIVFVTNGVFRDKRATGLSLNNTIVVFPEFQRLLATNNGAAVAYLAHELAFLLYELEDSKNDPLMAEVEADKFVCDIGLSNELEQLLLMLDETIEKRLRLTYLTINHFTRGN
jgi:hypothetical protein